MNPSDTSAAATTPDEREEAGFPIVGVGASAGGVEAMRNFVVALPPNPGVSLILVLHLPGDYSSHLPEIMAQNCALPVRTIHDGDLVERDVIHVLPPGQSVTLANGRLQLRPRPDLSEWHPVDRLFHSLASQAHERTVAVILSGTGTNGSSALGAIKNTSGLVIVQDPAEALFKDMPRNAIATGLVDHTATCAGIAAILADWGRRLPVAEQPLTTDADQVDGILELVRNHTGRDFSNYKRGTMQRRIYRRSSLLRQESLASYRELCRHQPAEIELLSRDLLIGVTSFFRDRPTWELLERELLPPLLDHRRADEPFRAWVAGCSTGEEAYSLAIAIHEVQARHGNHRPVQIFATDLDRSACDAARQGVFPAAAMTGLKDEQVAQHFIKDAHGFRLVQAHPRHDHLRPAQPAARSTVLPSRPDQLPQRPHLPRQGSAA